MAKTAKLHQPKEEIFSHNVAFLISVEFCKNKDVKFQIAKQKISNAQALFAAALGFFDKIKKISHTQIRKEK